MQLFFQPEIKETDTIYSFDAQESKHILKVLRKVEGDEILITNGQGLLITAKITTGKNKQCQVSVENVHTNHPSRHYLHMAVAPTKMNDRFEWFLEKATEIGVHEITPVICQRSERKVVKMDRMERVVHAALKQSFQTFLPKVNEAISLNEFLKLPQSNHLYIGHCEESERHDLFRRVVPDSDLTILIGPEGDFTPTEIKMAGAKGYLPVSLGKTRLRTETAAMVACTTVALANNL